MNLRFLPGEVWWCGKVYDGARMPVTASDDYELDLTHITPNQGMPLLLSNAGRWVWSDEPFAVSFRQGEITLPDAGVKLARAEDATLRGAYRAAMRAHFPFVPTPVRPECISAPVYNTWIAMGYEPTQSKVLSYARSILAHGMEPGILMIDDNWFDRYGSWQFDTARFPEPRRMTDELHGLGFRVMLWVCPYVSPVGQPYLTLRDQGLLIRDESGEPRIFPWWNGYSAQLDWSSPAAAAYFQGKLDGLVTTYGVDGFKFDAGQPEPSQPVLARHRPLAPNEDCQLYGQFGLTVPLAEYREGWKLGGQPLMMRLQDKAHAWDGEGLGALIPHGLVQSLTGYAYHCPDMVGGGEIGSMARCGRLDTELFVRCLQCSALFPILQFSLLPFDQLSEDEWAACLEALALRRRLTPYLLECTQRAAREGEPILQPLDYAYPGQGFDTVTDAYAIGARYVCYPVLRKGAKEIVLRLPEGDWRGPDGALYRGEIRLRCDLHTLPLFERVDAGDR